MYQHFITSNIKLQNIISNFLVCSTLELRILILWFQDFIDILDFMEDLIDFIIFQTSKPSNFYEIEWLHSWARSLVTNLSKTWTNLERYWLECVFPFNTYRVKGRKLSYQDIICFICFIFLGANKKVWGNSKKINNGKVLNICDGKTFFVFYLAFVTQWKKNFKISCRMPGNENDILFVGKHLQLPIFYYIDSVSGIFKKLFMNSFRY